MAVVMLAFGVVFGNASYALAEFNAAVFVTQNNVLQPTIRGDEAFGALVYTIPLVVPPGRNGLQPDVSLVYNNQRSNKRYMYTINCQYIHTSVLIFFLFNN